MKEETRKQLQAYEEKNAHIFQVMGSLKLLNIKVKTFVRRLEKVADGDQEKQKILNTAFQNLQKDIEFFKEEHRHLVESNLYVPSVDTFANNADRLFPRKQGQYSILEMKRISVYIYRMADLMLKELADKKNENEEFIHDIHAKNGKYYFNRK